MEATGNVLKRLRQRYPEIRDFRDRVEVIVPSRYYKRWARRLQEFGFTREDARVLSLGTFSTDKQKSFLGVDELLTFDRPMVNLFNEKEDQIQKRLEAMQREIEPPYDEANCQV